MGMEIRELIVDELSLVDRPANRHKFVFVKRAHGELIGGGDMEQKELDAALLKQKEELAADMKKASDAAIAELKKTHTEELATLTTQMEELQAVGKLPAPVTKAISAAIDGISQGLTSLKKMLGQDYDPKAVVSEASTEATAEEVAALMETMETLSKSMVTSEDLKEVIKDIKEGK